MITGVKELILYRDLENGQILLDMTWILEHLEKKEQISEVRDRFFSCMHDLVELAGNYGFENNLWHNYLTFLLVNNENIFSTACEIRGVTEGSLLSLARHDFAIFRELFACDFTELERMLQAGVFEEFLHYARTESTGKLFNRRIRDRICELSDQLANAETLEVFTEYMVSFYKEFGVGKLGLHKAFRVAHVGDDVQIEPITNIAHVKLEDLVGYELQKKKLIDNTEAFVEGRSANNCLLFGDAGTGKSSSIKAILNRYYDRGLRIIEVYKHQFQDLNEVIAQIKNRNYKFIIYMDDLSFEEFEIEYKYLKAVIEGGMETKPDNVLIYATSNRRHLIRETWSDRSDKDEELHRSDTVQEKLSLAARFGVSINYSKPTQQEYFQIVTNLAKKYPEITMSDKELCAEANKWELSHGGISGRTAQQFINYIAGKSDK